VTKIEAEKFLESVTNDYWGFPDSKDIGLLEEYGINLVEETA
jgi:hypothetical protein